MDRFGLSSSIITAIIELGEKYNIKQIKLFGSRARGDYQERSDIDLAVSGGDVVGFSTEIDDGVPTLLKFDIVNMDMPVQKELIDSIESEGVIIYEKV